MPEAFQMWDEVEKKSGKALIRFVRFYYQYYCSKLTVWHEIFAGTNFREISRVFQWSAKIRSRKNKFLRKKIPWKFTLTIYLECWISIKLTWNNIISTVGKIPDRKLPEIRKSLLSAVKSEIQIRENLFPRNAKSQQSTKLNSRENFMSHSSMFLLIKFIWESDFVGW